MAFDHSVCIKNSQKKCLPIPVYICILAPSNLFQRILAYPDYYSLVPPISTHTSVFQHIRAYFSLYYPIPAYSSLFQPISTYFSLFQFNQAYFSLYKNLLSYFNIFHPFQVFRIFQPFLAYSSLSSQFQPMSAF